MMNNNPKSDNRVIRVFISSTFCDMQAERDILIKKIFPQLRKLCEERAVIWTEVDLRWGITTEEASEGKVLPLCLAEIQRCRPYFIGLLGERYGWVPEESAIPRDLLETQPWLKEFPNHSVTELEIIYGVLRDPVMTDRSLFYFRDPLYVEKIPKEKRKDFISENDVSYTKLDNLKQSIRDAYKNGKLRFAPREKYADPESLGEQVLADFSDLIEKLYPKEQVPDLLDQEAARHEAYATSRRMAFVGRDELLRQIDNHVTTAGAMPLVLTGDSGCGKSALLAEWTAMWCEKNPDDLVIQHYFGSTPESADWQGLVRRILGELKRVFAITDKLPMQPDALRVALQEWLTKAAGKRRVILVLDALNQLSADDPTARQLGWLPFAFPPNIRLLVSSLPGESLEALRQRNLPELNVPLFGSADIIPAAETYFALFSKKLPKDILIKLESNPAATNALYLRSVLDELRQFGRHEGLIDKAAGYLAAPNLPDLFNRILTRWHDDFGNEKEHPDLVRRSLCLIACARFGLSEAELLDMLGKGKEPIPRRYWTPLYLAIENALVQRAGLLTFGHDYLRAAVHRRWLMDDKTAQPFRLHLAEYFGKIPELSDRKLDELPTLLRDTAQWERLKNLLADLPTFLKLRKKERWKWELHGYWLALEGHFDPVEVYFQALSDVESDSSFEQSTYLLNEIGIFHLDAGRYIGAEPLLSRALEVRKQMLGMEHPDTLGSTNNFASLLSLKGDYKGAELLLRSVLKVNKKMLGNEHPDTLTCMHNLANLLYYEGDYSGAEPLFQTVLDAHKRVLGPEHPNTLQSMNDLAMLLNSKKDFTGAEVLFRSALETRKRVLGPEHPNTLQSMNNLGLLLYSMDDKAGAEPFCRLTLKGFENVLGKEHPETLISMYNLAVLLDSKGDKVGAESLYRSTLEARKRVLGLDHNDTLMSMDSLADLLFDKNDYTGAEQLYSSALETRKRVLGDDHSDTLKSMNNLTFLYKNMGNDTGAEQLYHQALKIRERVLGKEHPDTLGTMSDLALLLSTIGNHAEAEQMNNCVVDARIRVLGTEHPDTLCSVNNSALLLYNKGDYVSAEAIYRNNLKDYERVLGKDHLDTLNSVYNLAVLLHSKGDFAQAEQLYLRVVAVLYRISQQTGKEHPHFQTKAKSYVGMLMQTGLSEEKAVARMWKMLWQ